MNGLCNPCMEIRLGDNNTGDTMQSALEGVINAASVSSSMAVSMLESIVPQARKSGACSGCISFLQTIKSRYVGKLIQEAKTVQKKEEAVRMIQERDKEEARIKTEALRLQYKPLIQELKKKCHETQMRQMQSVEWKNQGLCPSCGNKIGFFGKCKNCKVAPSVAKAIYTLVVVGDISWKVLEVVNNRALLLSEKIIEEKSFHNKDEDVNWSNSSLRKYLNNEFYNRLNDWEKDMIVEANLENKANPWYSLSDGYNTIDKIFLLSLKEIVKYFGDSGQYKNPKKGETYWANTYNPKTFYSMDDHFNKDRIAIGPNGMPLKWWLRTTGSDKRSISVVDQSGIIGEGGVGARGELGVRPALWLNIEK